MTIESSVVMPHFNDLKGLEACLSRLDRQTVDRGRFEIIVVDNASSVGIDAVRHVVGDRARLVSELRQGAAHARNAGVAVARGRTLAFIDSDCLPEPDWLEQGMRALAREPVVGGRVQVTVSDPSRPTAVEAFEVVFAFHNETYIRRKGFSVTANLFVRAEVFAKVGGFIDGVSEDSEWCFRAASLGFPVRYSDEARVGHPARVDWDQLTRKWRRLVRESYQLNRDRPAGRLRWSLRNVAVLVSPIGHAPKLLLDRRLRWRDRVAALGVLFRIRAFRFVEGVRVMGRPR